MEWKTAWSYLPTDYHTVIGTVENITQRTCIKNNINGTKAKVKFSNRYGEHPLVLETVSIGKRSEINGALTDSNYITVGGNRNITIPPFSEFYSDEIPFLAQAGTWIEISLFIKEKTPISSVCATWSAESFRTVYVRNGDNTRGESFCGSKSREIYPLIEADVNKATVAAGFCEVCVLTEEAVKTVVLFGDSITHMSYYADALLERVIELFPGKVTIINRGIGGNRILRNATYVADMPGNGRCFGKAAVERFEEDVCTGIAADMVIVAEGINDIMHPFFFQHPEEEVTSKDLTCGIEKMIHCAHKHGIRVYIGTLMPFKGEGTEWMEKAEVIRKECNEWIMAQALSDGVAQFAKAVEREENADYMIEAYHIGDGLHPGKEGGTAMAQAIPIAWFD